MANEETVTKVVEGVDRLFDEIVVNGRTVKSAPARQSAGSTPVSTNQSEPPIQGEYVKAIQLNNVLHDIKDKALTDIVGDISTVVTNLQGSVDTINSKIPSTASAQNQLADKDFVNSGLNSITSLIPSEATTSNQLADKNYVGNEITDAIDDLDVAEVGGNGKYIKSIKQEDGKIVAEEDYLSGTGGGVAFVGTRAEYEVAKLIPLGQTGHIPSGSLVIITDEDAYTEGEER